MVRPKDTAKSNDTLDAKELLGALFERGMTHSSQRRIENSMNQGNLADILEREFGAAPAPSKPPAPARVPVGAQVGSPTPASRPYEAPKSAPSQSNKPAPSGGLGDMFGKSFKGAAGAGALALLGAIAMKVLRGSSQSGASSSPSRLTSGTQEAASAQNEQQTQSLAQLIIKAMVNAAKADGQIDEDELQKIVGELQGDGITQTERDFLLAEVRKPVCTAEIVRAVPDRQVGAQVYAASLLAIEVDTPAEQAYLRQLAGDLGLDAQLVSQIHAAFGVA